MIIVIFELETKSGKTNQYFEQAESLKAGLETVEGFISIERFQSVGNLQRFLSLSFWKNEDAVRAWRNECSHREAQSSGRAEIFSDYRLRVASVIRDYGLNDRIQAPQDSRDHHD